MPLFQSDICSCPFGWVIIWNPASDCNPGKDFYFWICFLVKSRAFFHFDLAVPQLVINHPFVSSRFILPSRRGAHTQRKTATALPFFFHSAHFLFLTVVGRHCHSSVKGTINLLAEHGTFERRAAPVPRPENFCFQQLLIKWCYWLFPGGDVQPRIVGVSSLFPRGKWSSAFRSHGRAECIERTPKPCLVLLVSSLNLKVFLL